MIPFNKPYLTGKEAHYMYKAVFTGKLSGNGYFTKKCQDYFEKRYGFKKCLLTTSGSDALEMCAMLCELKPGDEVIVPSYTFVSTALAFLREGAKVIFADSMDGNPNLDAEKLESLITPRTRVIAPVHYAGVACNMDAIMAVAEKHNLLVVEDAAQAIDSFYKGKPLGGEVIWEPSRFMRPKISPQVVRVDCSPSMTNVSSAVPRLFGKKVQTVPSSSVVQSTSMVGWIWALRSCLPKSMPPFSGHSWKTSMIFRLNVRNSGSSIS